MDRRQYQKAFIVAAILSFLILMTQDQVLAANVEPVLSNVTGGGVTISWLTATPCPGKVKLYSPSGDQVYSDARGDNFNDTAHYVIVGGLRENQAYEYALLGQEDQGPDTENSRYHFVTGPNLIPAGSMQPAGRLFLADGVTPAAGIIVYLTIVGKDGASAPLSNLSDKNGYWFAELVNSRRIDHQQLYEISLQEDELEVHAVGGLKGEARLRGNIFDNSGGKKLYSPLILK